MPAGGREENQVHLASPEGSWAEARAGRQAWPFPFGPRQKRGTEACRNDFPLKFGVWTWLIQSQGIWSSFHESFTAP